MDRTNLGLMCLFVAILALFLAPVAVAAEAPEPPAPANPDDTVAESATESAALPAAESGASVETHRTEPVIVTATRTEKDPHDIPSTVYSFDLDEIQGESLARSIPDVFREVPGVLVQKTSTGQGSPFLRGWTGFRNVFLIDGIRLNNSTFREGPNQYWATVDPFSVRALEIEKGAGSVLYGSDAVGGTVQALTIESDEIAEDFAWNGRIMDRIATAEDSNIVRTEFGMSANGNVGILGGVTIKDLGDIEAGGDTGHQPKTGFKEWDGDMKFEYFLDSSSKLVLAFQHVDQDDAWRTHATVFGTSFEGSTIGSDKKRVLDQNRDLLYLQYIADDRPGFIESVKGSLSWHRQDEEQLRIRSDLRRDKQGVTVNTLGAWLQLGSTTTVGNLTYGVDYYRDFVDSFQTDVSSSSSTRTHRIQGPVGDAATYDLLGLYVQDDIPIFDVADLIVGLRFTHADVHAEKVQDPATGDEIEISDDWQNLVGSARLLVRLDEDEHWHAFGGVGQSFRAPNLSDLTRLDTARTDEIEVPSFDLDPEEFISYEVGLKTRYDSFEMMIAYFYTDIRSLITRTPTGEMIDGDRVVAKRNAEGGFVEGIELASAIDLGAQFRLWGNLAWMDGEATTFPTSEPISEVEPLSRLLPTTGTIGLRWDHPERRLWGEAMLTVSDRQDNLSTSDMLDTQRIPPDGTPGYEALTLRGGWQITDALGATAVLENVFDEDYRIHGSGQNEPCINFIMSVDWIFGGGGRGSRK